jgi:hypothetical protein
MLLIPAVVALTSRIRLEWSDPVLVAGPTATYPTGPPVPDSFFAFDRTTFTGPAYPGSNTDSWSFSADAGRSWSAGGPSVPHPGAPKIPVGPGHYRSLGGGSTSTPSSWNLTWPRDYTLAPDGSNFTITAATGGVGPEHTVRFTGVPAPGVNVTHPTIRPGTRNYGLVRMSDGRYIMTTCILWNGLQPRPGPEHADFTPFSVVAFTSSDGYTWEYASEVAKWDALGEPRYWGPNENDISLLSDNKTLICMLRMDGDSNCRTESYKYYYAAFSADNGRSWSALRQVTGAGCARPRLMRLPSGPLLLSGGRVCVENTTGIFLWVNEDGMGGSRGGGDPRSEWVRHSISYQHNRLWRGDPRYLYDERVNISDAWQTLSYTSMMVTGPDSVVLTYQRFFPFGPNQTVKHWPGPNVNFAIQVRVRRSSS